MKILGIIPARGGSKGIPKKNIKFLGSKPLLQYTTDVAKKSKLLNNIILSSDNDEIISVAKQLGIEVPFKRPSYLSDDKATSLSVVQHAVEFFEKKNIFFDAVCLLQVTYPFRTLGFLDDAISKFKISLADSLISVKTVPHEYNPHWTFEKNEFGNLKISTGESSIITRRQDLPEAFHRDGNIYLTKTSVIKEQNSFYGNTISYIESPKENYVNIDTLKDWKIAEKMLPDFLEKNNF